MRNRPSAPELFLDGLTSTEPELPPHAGLGALERRLTDWVDRGLERRSSAPWLLSLRLDERSDDEPSDDADRQSSSVVLELWLQAADDPTLALPTSLLHDGGDAVFGFLRSADPRVAVHRQLGLIEPVLAEGGLAFDAAEPTADRALRRRRPVRAPHGDPALRGARRAGAAAAQLGQLVEPPPRQPHRDERRGAIERAAHDRCARPVRLEARDRRHDADRGGADRARGGEGAADPRARALARIAALRGREGAAVPRAPPRGLRRRPRARRLGHRARGRRARARRRRRSTTRSARCSTAATSGTTSRSARRRR